MCSVIEFLSYQLEKDTGEEFHEIMREKSIPLHNQWEIKVLHYEYSPDDKDHYLLVRELMSFDYMEEILSSFYKSDAWRLGIREQIVRRIKNSTRTVLDTENLKS